MSDINNTPKIDTDAIVQQAKDELISSLGGGSENKYGWGGTDKSTGKPAPKDWDEIPDKILQQTDDLIEKKWAAKEEASKKEADAESERLSKQEDTDKQSRIDQVKNDMSRDFFTLVELGQVDDIGDDVKKKLQSGTDYNDLSDDEKADPGLSAWNKLQQLHIDKHSKGESTNLINTYKKFYKKDTANKAKNAPVSGGEPGVSGGGDNDMPSLEELRANARERGWRQ